MMYQNILVAARTTEDVVANVQCKNKNKNRKYRQQLEVSNLEQVMFPLLRTHTFMRCLNK